MKFRFAIPLSVLLVAGVFAFSTITAQAGNRYQDGTLEHGKYIATIAGCTSCHTPAKAEFQDFASLTLEQIQTIAFNDSLTADTDRLLGGGRAFDLGPAGLIFTRNISPDEETGIGSWTDDQLKIAIRTGVNKEGKILFPVMPYHVFNTMADADLDAVIAYLRSVNPVSNNVPKHSIPTDNFPTPPFQSGIVAPDPVDLAARGQYLVNSVMGCTDCHTPIDPSTGAPIFEKFLGGGQPYEGPWGIVYGGNITPDEETGIGSWTSEEIKRAILSGTSRDGRRLILMPWFAYSGLTAEDVDAVVYYLQNVLPAVSNQVPQASLTPEFTVMAPDAQPLSSGNNGPLSPILIVVVGIGVILFVSLTGYYMRKKTQ